MSDFMDMLKARQAEIAQENDGHDLPVVSKAGAKAAQNRDYYLKNKDRIAARKSARYQHDAEYQARIRERRRLQAQQEVEARRKHGPKRTVGRTMNLEFPDGLRRACKMLSITEFSTHIGVTAQTVRAWQKQLVVPEATYSTSGGHARFTVDQANVVREVYLRHKMKAGTERWRITDEFVAEIHAEWNKLVYGIKETDDE